MATRDFDCEVLIVGAGPVGLTLALALQRAGVDFRVIDRAEGFSGESKAITIQPRILEQLHLLGAAGALVDAGTRAFVMHMHDARRHLTTLRYDRLPTPFPFYLHLHQGQTERILAGLLGERGVEVERGVALQSFASEDDGVEVEVDVRGGAARRLRCRYLVGCDGGHSRVRADLGVEFSGERHRDNWIMADVRIANFDLARDQRHGFMLDCYPFVVLPMSDDYFRVIAARSPDSAHLGSQPDLREFAAIARGLGFTTWRFEEPLWLTQYTPSQFIASRFRRGPVFLAGDAAHVNTPIGAQGLNTGVMDAVNLAWKLSWVLKHEANELLLDSYHAERHPVVLGMFRHNDRLTRMVFGRNRLLRSVFREQLRLLEFGPLNLRNTSNSAQLSLGYRSSPVILKNAPAGRWARVRGRIGRSLECGDRAPCPRLFMARPGAEHLYDLLDPTRHTLLVFSGALDSVRRWAEREADANASWLTVLRFCVGARSDESATCRADPSGTIARAFGLDSGGAVLVRPDAFVAARLELGASGALVRYRELVGGVSARSDGPPV